MADLIDHDFSVSFCELCEIGTVRIEIENPFRNNDDADFTDIVITEDLRASGLTYVPNSTQFTGNGVTAPPNVQPAVGGPNNSVLTWTLLGSYVLPTRPNLFETLGAGPVVTANMLLAHGRIDAGRHAELIGPELEELRGRGPG